MCAWSAGGGSPTTFSLDMKALRSFTVGASLP